MSASELNLRRRCGHIEEKENSNQNLPTQMIPKSGPAHGLTVSIDATDNLPIERR